MAERTLRIDKRMVNGLKRSKYGMKVTLKFKLISIADKTLCFLQSLDSDNKEAFLHFKIIKNTLYSNQSQLTERNQQTK